jgi:hypothetical protein
MVSGITNTTREALKRALEEAMAATDYHPDHPCMRRWSEALAAEAELEHPNDRAFAALQTIIDYPITDPTNMDAANMKLIAIGAMTAKR